MLNQLFILALLTPIVFCRSSVSVNDRQWIDSDNRENCTSWCLEDCKHCHTPHVCDDETEVTCDCVPQEHLEFDLVINCPCNEQCIPKGCECVTDPKCPMICEVTCDEDEILCNGGIDDNGCRENAYCHPKGTGNNGPCPGYCPFDCTEDEVTCPVPDKDGCPTPPLCVPKAKDNNGDECDEQHVCPLICDIFEEQLCGGGRDHMNCPEEKFCLPKCIEACPVECGTDEIKCEGLDNCGQDCVQQDECKVKATNTNGEACPDDSASHGCAKECCGDTILCPGEKDSLGCLAPSTCEPTSKGMDNATCPHHSDCPTICEPHEVKCEITKTDDNGCKLPDECVMQDRDYDGELCAVQCPLECDEETEVFCPGQRNEKGCFEQDQCITRPVKTKGTGAPPFVDPAERCPGWCPPLCRYDQVKCPSQVDPCDGCPTEEVCVDIAVDLNDQPCPSDSASYGCPIICDDIVGETLCNPKENSAAPGCMEAYECKQRTEDIEGHWCPAHSVCPANCADDQIACTYGIDDRGCQEAVLCRAKGTDYDDELCVGVCPPTCKANEILTSSGPDAKGCEVAPTCISIE